MAGIVASVALAALGVLAVIDLLRIRADIEAGRSIVDELSLEEVGEVGLAPTVGRAGSRLERAADRARSSPWLGVLRPVPVIGDQVAGLRDLTRELGRLGAVATRAANDLDTALDAADEPAGRLALLDTALEVVDEIELTVASLDLGSGTRLLGPLASAHRRAGESVARASDRLDEARDLIVPTRELLAGPKTYVLLGANPAEMGATAGMTLSIGLVTFDGGDIDVSGVRRAERARLDPGTGVMPPGDLPHLYRQFTGLGVDFRSLTRSPDMATMGELARDMLQTVDIHIDGVVIVDPFTLERLLEVTGPVTVQDLEVTAENVVALTLHEAYKLEEERRDREELQGDIASAIFEEVTERGAPATELASALLSAAQDRHLLAWSDDPAMQHVWTELGADGAVSPHSLLVSFQNYGANKLDWYLRPEVALDMRVGPEGEWRGRLTMTMPTPTLEELEADGATQYIIGPVGTTHHALLLTVYLPATAYDITTPLERGFHARGRDGPLETAVFLFEEELGETMTRTVDFALPREQAAMLLAPSGRIEPVPYLIDGEVEVTDAEPTVITWTAAVPPPSQPAPRPVRALVVLATGLLLVAAIGTARLAWRAERHPTLTVSGSRAIWVSQLGVLGVYGTLAVAGLLAVLLSSRPV